MSPACTHKHSKGRGLLIFILVFTSFGIMPGCPFFYRKWCLKYCYLWTTSLPSPLTASFLPPDLPHTVCISEPVTHGNRKSTAQGWARPTERLQRRKDLSASKKRFSSHREKCCCGLTWLLGKRSRMCTQAPPWTPDTPHSTTKEMPKSDLTTLPFPSAPSLFSSENYCKKIYFYFLADYID